MVKGEFPENAAPSPILGDDAARRRRRKDAARDRLSDFCAFALCRQTPAQVTSHTPPLRDNPLAITHTRTLTLPSSSSLSGDRGDDSQEQPAQPALSKRSSNGGQHHQGHHLEGGDARIHARPQARGQDRRVRADDGEANKSDDADDDEGPAAAARKPDELLFRPKTKRPQGYLHDGHLALVEIAKRECGPHAAVVASVYVNPTQFAAHEDFDVYPRDADGDRAKLQAAGCVAVFEPASLYDYNGGDAGGGGGEGGGGASAAAVDAASVVGRAPPPASSGAAPHETFVTVEALQRPLCGVSRPHFFRGVATVVCKLFHVVEPDVAVFGRKDYQQLRVVERMVRDLDMAVRVVGAEISREPDGLAMSSRNARLSAAARAAAPAIRAALAWARDAAAAAAAPLSGAAVGAASAGELRDEVARRIEAAGGVVDYVEVRDARTLEEVGAAGAAPAAGASAAAGADGKGDDGGGAAATRAGGGREAVMAVAAHFEAKDRGTVRLIDNIELTIG